jgi:hypothetical protein
MSKVVFEALFAVGPTPRELLGVAAGALDGLGSVNGSTPWRIGRQPAPIPGNPGGLMVFCTTTYPIARA